MLRQKIVYLKYNCKIIDPDYRGSKLMAKLALGNSCWKWRYLLVFSSAVPARVWAEDSCPHSHSKGHSFCDWPLRPQRTSLNSQLQRLWKPTDRVMSALLDPQPGKIMLKEKMNELSKFLSKEKEKWCKYPQGCKYPQKKGQKYISLWS